MDDSSLIPAILSVPRDDPFVTMYRPDRMPDCETRTFGQFLDLASAIASHFMGLGIKPGDTILLIMTHDIPLMAAFVGAMLAGGIPSILAFPTFKIDPEKYRSGLLGVTQNIHATLVVLDQEFPHDLLTNLTIRADTRVIQLDMQAIRDVKGDVHPNNPRPDGVAFIQHSAGTTGLQKGVALSHRAVLNQLRHLSTALGLTKQDRIVSWLPLYHDMGLISCFILPLIYHIPLVMQSPTSWVMRPGTMLRLASDHRCTICWIPNFAYQFMARRVPDSEHRGLDLSCLRFVINCSEPVRLQSMIEFYECYRSHGLKQSAMQCSYAMAETTFAVTQSGPEGALAKNVIWADREVFWNQGRILPATPGAPTSISFVSSGPCLPANEIRVVTQEGTDLPDGYVGELLVRSDSLFGGYYNRPDLTKQALRDGWYWSSDLGFLVKGEVYVIGRKDDTIIIGGKNLYPQDVEEIVSRHPALHPGRAVAFGLYNSDLGTQDLVVVAEVNDAVDLERSASIEADVRKSVLGEIGVALRIVHLVPPKWLVKSTAGKPARSTNRKKYLQEHPEMDTNCDRKSIQR